MTTINSISIKDTSLIINYKGGDSKKTIYRGVNLSAYDMGSMSGLADTAGLCTDNDSSTGGWINYTTKLIKESNMASPYTVGNSGSVGYSLANCTKGSPLQPVTKENSAWATSYPQPNQIDRAISQGVNIFRVPIMPTFMKNLATGWAKAEIKSSESDFLYVPGNPKYFDFYMTTVDYIIKSGANVIIDNHVYQRWCPTNIPGTFSCLEGSGPKDKVQVSARNYSMDETTDMTCPYKLDQEGIDFFKTNNIKANWSKTDFSYIEGNTNATNITRDNITNSFCARATDQSVNANTTIKASDFNPSPDGPKGCTDITGKGCYGGPTKRILGIDCSPVLWYNMLNTSFTLVNKDGTSGKRYTSLKEYITDSSRKNQIWLGLMNEPNEVNTRDVGKAYGKVINVIRKMNIENTLLVEGNYWAGLHAQITPTVGTGGGTNKNITRPSAESEGWEYEEDINIHPAQIILDEITKANPNPEGLGDWKYDLHQYVDKTSAGIHACTGDQDSHVSTLDDMKFFTNFDAFEDWAKQNKVRAFVSEFGAQLGNPPSSDNCDKKLNLFIEMIERSDIIDGWTIWRNSPAISWIDATIDSWTNSVQFGPLDSTTASNISTWKPLYNNDKGFTDPTSTTFCMPQLWALKGEVTPSSFDFSKFTQ